MRFAVPEKEANPVCLYRRPNERRQRYHPEVLRQSPPALPTPPEGWVVGGWGLSGADEGAFGIGAQGPWRR